MTTINSHRPPAHLALDKVRELLKCSRERTQFKKKKKGTKTEQCHCSVYFFDAPEQSRRGQLTSCEPVQQVQKLQTSQERKQTQKAERKKKDMMSKLCCVFCPSQKKTHKNKKSALCYNSVSNYSHQHSKMSQRHQESIVNVANCP